MDSRNSYEENKCLNISSGIDASAFDVGLKIKIIYYTGGIPPTAPAIKDICG